MCPFFVTDDAGTASKEYDFGGGGGQTLHLCMLFILMVNGFCHMKKLD